MFALALLFAASLDSTAASAGLRSEARARTPVGSEEGTIQELQLDGRLAFSLFSPTVRLVAAYEPRLRAAREGGIREHLHQGILGARWDAAAGRTLRLEERAGFGETDFSPLGAVSAAPDRLPSSRMAKTVRSATRGSWDEILARGVRLGVTAAWEVSGGADAEARRTIPLQRGPRATALTEWDLSPVSVLGLALSGSATHYSNGTDTYLGGAELQLRRALEGDLTLEGAAGAGGASDGRRTRALPIAALRARWAVPGSRFAIEGSARVAPASDWLGAGVYERGEASATVEWLVASDLTLGLRAGGSAALTDLKGTNAGIATAQAGAIWTVSRNFSLDAGVRSAYLARPLAGDPHLQWLGLVGFSALVGEVLQP